jgi:hypothetical protein
MRKAAVLSTAFAAGYAMHIGVEYGLRALLMRVYRRNAEPWADGAGNCS